MRKERMTAKSCNFAGDITLMLRPGKLDIFIAKQFSLLFVGTFFICQFVLMMQFLWRYIDQLIGKGLSMDVLAQFFWYMGLMLVPQALPLAILLSSLITFGNLGESSELTAIKAAGISLMQSMRSLIVISVLIAIGSFYFQNVVGPNANMSFSRLLLSMKQKSPELEIPEGVFYDGIPGSNLYVQRKDMKTGMLYNIMIYRMTDSYEDAAIILADSGMMQSTAEKKHLLLTLHSGEWFENMKSQELAGSASVPYRRETFVEKQVLLDFDADFNMTDAGALSNNARGKSLREIYTDMDSLNNVYDSIGRRIHDDMKTGRAPSPTRSAGEQATTEIQQATTGVHPYHPDTLFAALDAMEKQHVMSHALAQVRGEANTMEFRAAITSDGDKLIRQHRIEAINKFTMALSCILFFFIGAPLGAIIRKGGLGFPVVISVLVFIVYYIFDNTGYRMARGGMWTIWFGKSISTAVLLPLAVFFTYKANNDSTVFNIDLYRNLAMTMLGLRNKRHVAMKEVVINDPDYPVVVQRLAAVSAAARDYMERHNLIAAPNFIKVFFKYEPDRKAERMSAELEAIIEELGNTKNKYILVELDNYPFMTTKAHTRPFERRWLNIMAAIIVPAGVFFYLRMWRFRLRLYKDLRVILHTNEKITNLINNM